jgi:hypothetical protein
VLRSYDSRFRPTNRSSDIYLDGDCRDIFGETTTTTILRLPKEDATANSVGLGVTNLPSYYYNHSFWDKSNGRTLLVIATPYRHGGHVAKKPKAFLPIIAQLEKLHEKGFVHGDIRAFNTVFGKQEDQGWLIDFNFGGKLGRTYPKGYRNKLEDGDRLGDGEHQSVILKWHDWYALCRLIFEIHRLAPPDEAKPKQLSWRITKMANVWQTRKTDPTPNEIKELRELLSFLDEQGWTIIPSEGFNMALQPRADASQVG